MTKEKIKQLALKYLGMNPKDYSVATWPELAEQFTNECMEVIENPIYTQLVANFEKECKDYAKKIIVEIFEDDKETYIQVKDRFLCERQKYPINIGGPIIETNTCNDEPIVDTIENITKKGIVINKTEKEGAEKYIFQLGNDLFHIKKVKNVYSYKGIVLHPRHAKIIDKVVNEYNSQFDKNRDGFDCERGHINNEEKKTCSFIFHEKARVIDVSTYWSNGVVYTIGNNGKNYTIERLNTSEFYYKGDILDNVSSMKLKDIIIDYWHNKDL